MNRIAGHVLRKGMVYFRLTNSETFALGGPNEVVVIGGRAWITVEGRADDVFLGPGGRFDVPGAGLTVIEADPSCVIGVRAPAARAIRPPLLRRLVRRAADRLRFGRPPWVAAAGAA